MKSSKLQLTFLTTQQDKLDQIKLAFLPYTKRIYIVGGFLRDTVMNIVSDDIDIEVFGVDQELFKKIMQKLDAVVLSEKFNVYNYKGIDIALPRVETKVSKGYHGFDIEITDDEFKATLRRDFTMNSLMYNILESKLYDFHNGLDDIEDKILRVVDEKSFEQDSLRLVRAVRFMAQFSLNTDIKTKEILKKMNIEELSKSRINKELQKVFT